MSMSSSVVDARGGAEIQIEGELTVRTQHGTCVLVTERAVEFQISDEVRS